MKRFAPIVLVVAVIFLSLWAIPISGLSEDHAKDDMHGSAKGMEGMKEMGGMKHFERMPPVSALKPAQGASVKIVSPQPDQVFTSDEVPLEYKFVKGKRASHLHAYVDGQLMGMFSDPHKGTLTGIQPGSHTLELRAVTADHKTELRARDSVKFVVK